jgi:hypothetical protein
VISGRCKLAVKPGAGSAWSITLRPAARLGLADVARLRLRLPDNATAKALSGHIAGLLWLPVICSASRVAQAWRQPPRPHHRPISEPNTLPTHPPGRYHWRDIE